MVGIFIVIGIGISGIWANEDNTGNNIDFSYQNRIPRKPYMLVTWRNRRHFRILR
jgi:hypothetical protein